MGECGDCKHYDNNQCLVDNDPIDVTPISGCSLWVAKKEQINDLPDYYKGKNGMEAHEVVENFQPDNYNLGTILTYAMRCGKKVYKNTVKDSAIADLEKIINHAKFEIKRLKNE